MSGVGSSATSEPEVSSGIFIILVYSKYQTAIKLDTYLRKNICSHIYLHSSYLHSGFSTMESLKSLQLARLFQNWLQGCI